MSDYLLISTGKKGEFKTEMPSLESCIDQGQKELNSGQTVTIFVKHSELKFGGVILDKSAIQIKAEQDAAKP